MYANDARDILPWATWGNFQPEWCLFPAPGDFPAPLIMHAEGGSVFPFVMGQPRMLLTNQIDTQWGLQVYPDPRRTNIFPVYNCPSSGSARLNNHVTYALSWCCGIFPLGEVRLSEVVNPAQKVLLRDQTDEVAVQWKKPGVTGIEIPNLISHNQPLRHARLGVLFVDGHVGSFSEQRALEIESSPELCREYIQLRP
jgi:prepilin-type processing-associated H-X9-DG protein